MPSWMKSGRRLDGLSSTTRSASFGTQGPDSVALDSSLWRSKLSRCFCGTPGEHALPSDWLGAWRLMLRRCSIPACGARAFLAYTNRTLRPIRHWI